MRYAVVILLAAVVIGCMKDNNGKMETPVIYSNKDSGVQPPRLKYEVYPSTDKLTSREAHYGQLRFEVVIDDKGNVRSTKVLESVSPRWPELEDAYMAARRQSQYAPARKGTENVWYRLTVTIKVTH
jgi:outer membrane biosynthesis protein TonB